MSTWLGLAAWVGSGATYAVIATLVVLAVGAHFFSRSVSLAAWALAVGALALLAVGKDALIARAQADAERAVTRCEAGKAAALGVAQQQRATNMQVAQQAAGAAALREQALARQLKEATHALTPATRNLRACVLSDDAVGVLNHAARGPHAD